MKERITYRSDFGDYGLSDLYTVEEIKYKLGKYEDLGYSPEELKEIIEHVKYDVSKLRFITCGLREALNV